MTDYVIPSSRIAAAQKIVDKANTRAEKAGISGRYTLTVGVEYVQPLANGRSIAVRDVTLSGTPLKYDNWEFLARVDVHPEATIVNAAPGVVIEDRDSIDGHNCDHCSVNRARKTSFLIKNTDNDDVLQVGSACLKKFLGFSPAIWFLESRDRLFDYTSGPYDYVDYLVPVRTVIAHAMTISDYGRSFVPARENGSTAGGVKMALDNGDHIGMSDEEADKYLAEMRDLNVSGDYGFNLISLLSSEYVKDSGINTIVSAVSVWRREVDRRVEFDINDSYLPFAPKERFRDHAVTVVSTMEFPGDYGVKTLVKMIDEENRQIVWWASKSISDLGLSADGKETIKAATVKAHDVYNEHCQTVVSRVVFA